MKEWLRAHKYYVAIVLLLVLTVLITHYADSEYYTNQISKLSLKSDNQEITSTSDFQNLLSQAWNININCSYFKNASNKAECQTDNLSKQSLQKLTSNGQTLPQGGY